MKKSFKDLKLGETFHTGIINGFHGKQVIVYKKLDKRRSEGVAQYGYGNTRMIGGLYPVAWCTMVTPCSVNVDINS